MADKIKTYTPERSSNFRLVSDIATTNNSVDFSTTTSYYLEGDVDVTIVNRQDYHHHLNSNKANHRAKKLIIRTTLELNSNFRIVKFVNDMTSIKDRSGCINEDIQNIIEELVNRNTLNNNLNYARIMYEKEILLDNVSANDVLYINDLDIVVYKGSVDPFVKHPYGEFKRSMIIDKNDEVHNAASVSIELIDNDNSISDRYFTALGKVFKIVPHKNLQKRSGAYVEIKTSTGSKVELIDFSSLEEKGIYPTHEKALSSGNTEHAYKESLLAFDQQVALQQKANLSLKEELEATKTKNLQLKDTIDARSLVRTDYYEGKSVERKEGLEIMKHVPAVAVGIVSCFAVMRAIAPAPKKK
jgi:hypothetical protein